MEFGPRALGGRSIIRDARSEKTQTQMNLSIKYRESFRPFAPQAYWIKNCRIFRIGYPLSIHAISRSSKRGNQNIPIKEDLEAMADLVT